MTTRNKNGRHRADDPERPLTEREQLFRMHYIGAANFVGAEAVIMAGYNVSSRQRARDMAHDIMRRPAVARAIELEMESRNVRLRVTADDVLRDLIKLKAEASTLKATSANVKTKLSIIEKIGDHVDVNAFRKQVGLSSPTGGPIETADAAWLARASDEELDALEHARAIIDRRSGRNPDGADDDGDSGGEGTPPPSA